MSGHRVTWLVLAIAVMGAWMLRYDIQTVSAGHHGGAYVLDRWTGQLTFCSPLRCRAAGALQD